jgi:hypothetical protein
MSRSMYGLHKAIGGIEKRRREMLEQITCGGLACHWKVKGCQQPAVGLLENWAGQPFPQCRTHLEQGRQLGYTIYEPSGTEENQP